RDLELALRLGESAVRGVELLLGDEASLLQFALARELAAQVVELDLPELELAACFDELEGRRVGADLEERVAGADEVADVRILVPDHARDLGLHANLDLRLDGADREGAIDELHAFHLDGRDVVRRPLGVTQQDGAADQAGADDRAEHELDVSLHPRLRGERLLRRRWCSRVGTLDLRRERRGANGSGGLVGSWGPPHLPHRPGAWGAGLGGPPSPATPGVRAWGLGLRGRRPARATP